MQMVPPATDAGATEGKPVFKSTALSQRHFETSLANTRAALKVAESLCDVLAKPGHEHTGASAQTLEAMIRQATSTQAKVGPVKVEGKTNGDTSPQSMSLKTLLTKVDPSNPIAVSVLLPLHKQSTRHQLHALALCFKSIFMHMLLLEQDCTTHTIGRTTSTASATEGTKVSPVTVEVAAAASVPPPPAVRISWSNVILASNTATSFIDTHGLDMTYCPFFAALFHLNIQIKLKYVKSCVASFKRSQNWQLQQAKKKLAGEISGERQVEDLTKDSPPPGVVISLPTATQSLLDSLHYLHIDFTLLDALTHHWKTFTAETCRDAQLRITELLDFLAAPVGGQPAKDAATPMEVDGKADAAPATSPKQKAVEDFILEEALRVHRTIQQRFPLFKVGHSIAKQMSLVSAIMLDVAHQTTAGQMGESEHSSTRSPTQAISVKRTPSMHQQQPPSQQLSSTGHMTPAPFPGVILPLLPSPQTQSRAMVQPPAPMYSAAPASTGYGASHLGPQPTPQSYPYMQQMPNYGQYAPSMPLQYASQQPQHPQHPQQQPQMHQTGAMGMMMPNSYQYGYQVPALAMPQNGMPPSHTSSSPTAPPLAHHGLKRKQLDDSNFELQKPANMNYGALPPYPSYSTTSSMTSFGFSQPQQPPPFYQPQGYMPQSLAQPPQQQQAQQLPTQPSMGMNPHAFHATVPADFNPVKRTKV